MMADRDNKKSIAFICEFSVTSPQSANIFQSAKMAEAFSGLGYDVEFWVRSGTEIADSDIGGQFNLKRSFPIKKIGIYNFSEKIFPGKLSLSLGYILMLLWPLFSGMGKEKTIYTRDIFIAWIMSLYGYKVCLELHYLFENKKALYRMILKRIDGIVVIAEAIKANLMGLAFPEEKILLWGSAADVTEFMTGLSKTESRRILKLPEDKVLLGYVGMLSNMGEEKGVGDIIKAMTLLDDGYRLVVVGGFQNETDRYRLMCESLKIGHRVEFFGYQERGYLPVYFKAFDLALAVFPGKRYARSLSPLKVYEYMAGGVPIVASDNPSIRSLLNENNAWLVAPDDPGLLAEAIKQAINDATRQKKAEQARRDVKNFSWSRRAEAVGAFIDNMRIRK